MWAWPFRHQKEPTKYKTSKDIYDDIGGMPDREYNSVLREYNEQRLRKGYLHNVMPMTVYSGAVGSLYGLYSARRTVRHANALKTIGRYGFSFAVVGCITATSHQILIVMSDYHTQLWQTAVSGSIGGSMIAFTTTGNVAVSAMAGCFIGLGYTCAHWGLELWRDRALRIFLHEQQQQQIPISRITPELQEVYRAFLFDNRPMEESDMERRRLQLAVRKASDTRLDAKSHMDALSDAMTGITMPAWWPIKFGEPDPNSVDAMARARAKEDEIERRKKKILNLGDPEKGDDFFANSYSKVKRQEREKAEAAAAAKS
eukprot:PhM_4_TR6171/c0_g1_i1/m.48100